MNETIFELVNILQIIAFKFNTLFGYNGHVKKNSNLKDEKKGERFFIVGNGPSVKEQNILNLTDENTIFVNMGFKHQDYMKVLPKYHVIVDPKLANGEWDIDILDHIVNLNPEVTLVLNSKWFYEEKFKPYINNPKINIIWIRINLFFTRFHHYNKLDITSITYGMGVLGASVALANYLGAKEIILIGVESNAFCNEFENKESHFYGLNKDNVNMGSEGVYKSLFFNYLYLMGLHNLARKSQNISIVNCTPAGILKMFRRDDFKNKFTNRSDENERK
jgi:hypothetical protein